MMNHIFRFFLAAGIERGAEQYVRLAADPTLEDVSGMYFVKGTTNNEASSPLARDPAVQKRIDEAAETWAAPFCPFNTLSRPINLRVPVTLYM